MENTEYIVAIELLWVAQAIEFRGSEKRGKGTKIAYVTIRKTVSMLTKDRVQSEDIEKIRQLIKRLLSWKSILTRLDHGPHSPILGQKKLM